MSWLSDIFGDVLDPAGIFHTTTSQRKKEEKYDADYALQLRSLLNQENAQQWQQMYDAHALDMAERNFQLQSSPVSSVVNDAQKVGVNAMAALGQSVGSASVGGSSVSGTSGVSNPPIMDNTGSILSALGSVGSAHINAAQDDKDSKRATALRQQELDIIREKNQHDYELGLRGADIAQQNADSNSSQAETANKTLNVRQAELAFEKIKAKKYYNLQKDMNDFTKKMSRQQFERSKFEFNQKLQLEKQDLSQKLQAIRNDKDFKSDYIRMQYITRFGTKVVDLLGKFFGVTGSQAEGFREDFLDEMLKGGL